MQKYELMLMLFPDMGEKQTTEELSSIKELLQSLKGKIFHEDIWGVRELAYTIKKHDSGYYVVFNLEFPGENIAELEQSFNINQAVMRYMMVKISDNYEYVPMSTYDAIAEKERAEREKALAEKRKKHTSKRPTKSKPAPKKASKPAVEDKLKDIVSDPDISL